MARRTSLKSGPVAGVSGRLGPLEDDLIEINHPGKVCAEQDQCGRLADSVNQQNKFPEVLHSLCSVATEKSQVPYTSVDGGEENTTRG